MMKLTRPVFFVFFLYFSQAALPQGMWLPEILSTVQDDMQAKGCLLKPDDIYSVNHSSMKDGVLIFGGGCTGEMISDSGLVLTNHHCGLGEVQSHSSVDHDYVTNGFWAMKRGEELPCPGLSVTFIHSMEDVSNQILPYVKNLTNEVRRKKVVDSLSQMIALNAIHGGHYGASVREFYNGNQYILILSETFNDVRLVGAPPIAIGNFGGESDNWMWPRHTGDFSLFRVYANSKNEPAPYSPANQPYRPGYYFPISLNGEQENDFTMVYGFPGRTQEYASSYAVQLIQQVSDPERVEWRGLKLNAWWKAIQASDSTRIKYISKYYGLANGWKKMQGEMKGLDDAGVVARKTGEEQIFTQRIDQNPEWKARYGQVLPLLKQVYDSLQLLQPLADFYGEGFQAPELIPYVWKMKKLLAFFDEKGKVSDPDGLQKALSTLRSEAPDFFKDYDAKLDEQVFLALGASKANATQISGDLLLKQAAQVFASPFCHLNSTLSLLNANSKTLYKMLKQDAALQYALRGQQDYERLVLPYYQHLQTELIGLNRQYMEAQLLVFYDHHFYPDANFSLRVAYGAVKPYHPRDAVQYGWFTTLDGVIQKHLADTGNSDYKVPARLVDLWKEKDYGPYADKDGSLHTCFIAANHTTGGNSGSPVFDAKGNLIGTNFDRVWEGTMSDLAFDSRCCRNIILDIRYTLFIIDKYAGAGYLLKEMKVVR